MKKSKTVKIKIDEKTEKEFTVSELTTKQIISLGQNNPLFGATLNDDTQNAQNDEKPASTEQEKGFLADMIDMTSNVSKVIKISCDFSAKDLIDLAPSDIEKIFNDWKGVNQTFLTLLEKMGIISAGSEILKRALSDFLRTLAI